MKKSSFQFFTSPQSLTHSYYISKEEKIFSFGNNCSLGDDVTRDKPEEVKFFSKKKIRIKEIDSGGFHSFFQTINDDVFSVGYNLYGQLSLGDEKDRYLPDLITCFGKKKINKIRGGRTHSVFIVEESLYSSGFNSYGQLGLGNKENQLTAKKINIREKIKLIECGFSCSLFVSVKNEIYKTGIIYCEKICLVPTLFFEFPKEEQVNKISIGHKTCLILCSSQKVFGLGLNLVGNLGTKFPLYKEKPTKVQGLSGIVDVKACHSHSIFLEKSGNALGMGVSKCLGNRTDSNEFGIFFLKDNIVQIEGGSFQTFLLHEKKELFSGGRNKEGELGSRYKGFDFEELQKNTLVKNIKEIFEEKITFVKRFWDVIINCSNISISLRY